MSEKVYFRNLHVFRFIAAVLVILSHIELFKARVGMNNRWTDPFFFEAGGNGRRFLFCFGRFSYYNAFL